ncbi:MAG: hypothetical protein IKH28_10510 [Lachnospiraceae bacterium]|nr:hypothetical protein [Lachnospiraceae bacterium]
MGSKLYFAVFELLSLLSYSVSAKIWKLEKMLFCNCLNLRFFMYYERNWASSDFHIHNSNFCFVRIHSLGAKNVENDSCVLSCSINSHRMREYIASDLYLVFSSNPLFIFLELYVLECCYRYFDGREFLGVVYLICKENRRSTVGPKGLFYNSDGGDLSVYSCWCVAGFDEGGCQFLFVDEQAFRDQCYVPLSFLFHWSAFAGVDEKQGDSV